MIRSFSGPATVCANCLLFNFNLRLGLGCRSRSGSMSQTVSLSFWRKFSLSQRQNFRIRLQNDGLLNRSASKFKTTFSLPRYCFLHSKGKNSNSVSLNSVDNLNFDSVEHKPTITHDGKSLLDRFVFVKTLEHLYADVPNGIVMDTAYADSRPSDDFDPHVPVVVGLHDTPGTHRDLIPVLSTFAKLGCRTIAPTYPGHGETRGVMRGFDDIFCQAAVEKAAFVHDFLTDLGIKRVDLLIAVGASAYPALNLCAGASENFYRSLAFVSPWPFSRSRYSTDVKSGKFINEMWERPFLRYPARLMMPLLKMAKAKTTEEKVTSSYLQVNMDFGETCGHAMAVCYKKVPRVVIFKKDDKHVTLDLYHEVLDKLEIPQDNILTFQGRLGQTNIPGALAFPGSGDDIHQEHTGVLCAYLMKLIQKFHPHIKI